MSGSSAIIAVVLAVTMSEPADQNPAPQPQTNTAGPVQSTGQAGGVTAGNIGTLNQVMPTLVRGPLLQQFKDFFSEGARLRLSLFQTGLTDEEYRRRLDATSDWANRVDRWLRTQFGDYAAERFNFRTSPALSYNGGPTDGFLRQAWENRNSAMTGWLQNLDLLMREPSLYPEH